MNTKLVIKPLEEYYEDIYFIGSDESANCWGVFEEDKEYAYEYLALFTIKADAELFVKAKHEYSNSHTASK